MHVKAAHVKRAVVLTKFKSHRKIESKKVVWLFQPRLLINSVRILPGTYNLYFKFKSRQD